MPEHTPLPWKWMSREHTRYEYLCLESASGSDVVCADCDVKDYGQSMTPYMEIDPKNAAFIVRACNAHDDLVVALKAGEDASAVVFAQMHQKFDEVRRLLSQWAGVAEPNDLVALAAKLRKAAITKATKGQ